MPAQHLISTAGSVLISTNSCWTHLYIHRWPVLTCRLEAQMLLPTGVYTQHTHSTRCRWSTFPSTIYSEAKVKSAVLLRRLQAVNTNFSPLCTYLTSLCFTFAFASVPFSFPIFIPPSPRQLLTAIAERRTACSSWFCDNRGFATASSSGPFLGFNTGRITSHSGGASQASLWSTSSGIPRPLHLLT